MYECFLHVVNVLKSKGFYLWDCLHKSTYCKCHSKRSKCWRDLCQTSLRSTHKRSIKNKHLKRVSSCPWTSWCSCLRNKTNIFCVKRRDVNWFHLIKVIFLWLLSLIKIDLIDWLKTKKDIQLYTILHIYFLQYTFLLSM